MQPNSFHSYKTKKRNNSSSTIYRESLIFQLILFKLFGLAPWSMNVSKIIGKNIPITLQNYLILDSSLYGAAYNILLIIIWIIYNVYSSLIVVYEKKKFESLITKTVAMNLIIFSMVSPIFMWIFYLVHQRIIITVINKLMHIDKTLHRYSAYLSIKNNAVFLIFLTNFVLYNCYVISLMCAHPMIVVPIRSIPSLISSLILIQYSMILDAFYKQFNNINLIILQLSGVNPNIELQKLFVSKMPLRRPIRGDIDHLNRFHAELCDMCGKVSKFYGLPVLLTILYFSAASILLLYYIFIFFSNPLTRFQVFLYLGDAAVFSIMIFGFIVMTFSVNRVIKESKKTSFMVHLILDRCTMDDKLENQLIEFSFDLLHRKVEFTACGIISLDGSLLQSVLGTIVTYLVILIQFYRGGSSNDPEKLQTFPPN
ncbi:GSCOCT00014052001.2-RA-CDS [Cotesia congregata]|uniref:Gustatory receptor n=1 Tax=Cotesia congregata TaxID=51543 RepID=A0A8J2MHU1_COTCN|nr:GSCOCT00014052001.2-RA-CDS [Cotesia congregata]CAG5084173.1 gustatory receptor 69 [Cotesia congregata]